MRLAIKHVLDVHAIENGIEWTQRSSTVNVAMILRKIAETHTLRGSLYSLLIQHNPYANLSMSYAMLERAGALLATELPLETSRKRTYYSEMSNRHLEEMNGLRNRLRSAERQLEKRARLEKSLRGIIREKDEVRFLTSARQSGTWPLPLTTAAPTMQELRDLRSRGAALVPFDQMFASVQFDCV